MKTTCLLTMLVLLGCTLSKAQQETDFGFNILSTTEQTLDGNVTFIAEYFVYEDCIIPNPDLVCTMAGATLTKTDPARFAGESYAVGNQFTTTFSLAYDVNTLPYYPKSFTIEHSSGSQQFAAMGMIYITPYNTVEIWNMSDFNNLPRTWIVPADGTPEPARIYVDAASIPASDIPANYAPTEPWQTDFHEVMVQGLAYSIPMLPEEPDGPTNQAYESGGNRADGCVIGFKRWRGYITGSVKGYLMSNNIQQSSNHPLKGIRVEIWDQGTGDLLNFKLGHGHTDANGNFSVWIDVCKLGEGNEMEIFLKIFAESTLDDNRKIKVHSGDISGLDWLTIGAVEALAGIDYFSIRGDKVETSSNSWYYNEGDQSNLNLGTFMLEDESYTACHLANTGWHFASDYSGKTIEDKLLIHTHLSFGSFFLPDKVCGESTAAILDMALFNKPHIFLISGGGYYENLVWHEFGHFVMWQLQDKCWSEPISSGYAEHGFLSSSNPRIAWTEGWASGFAQIVDLHYSFFDNEYAIEEYGRDIENGFKSIQFYDIEIGYDSEFAIAAAIYDLYDGPDNTQHLNFQPLIDDSGSLSAWDDDVMDEIDDVEFTFAQICKPIWDGKSNGYNGQLENVMDYINGLYSEAGCSSDRHYIKKCFDNNYVVYDVDDRWNTGSSSDQITQKNWESYEGTGEPPFDNAPYYFELYFENELSVIDEFGESFNFVPSTIPSIHGRISDNLLVKANGDLFLNNQTLPRKFIAEGFPNLPGSIEANIDICSGAQVEVRELGSIVLGDNIDNKVNLFILSDARLWINGGGYCLLHPGSSIIIEDNGMLQISEGALRLQSGSSIVINPGGKLLFEGGGVFMNGSDTKIVLAGGLFEVADNQIFQMSVDQGQETGYFEVASALDHELIMGQNAQFKLQGSGQEDLILKITDWVNL